MESARHELILLVQLQQIYNQIAEAIRERQTPPPEVEQLQEQNRDRELELEEMEGHVEVHSQELQEIRKREDEWRLELEHFQKQKAIVTNEREFTAVISEIDYATKALNDILARREELENTIAELNSEIETRRSSRPEEEEEHRQVVDHWEGRKSELKQSIHGLAEAAHSKEAELSPKHRARFHRLLESKRGTAVAAVVDGSCSVCHFALRPHLQQRVRRCDELIACEHCHRILFLPDILDDASSETSTG